MVGRFCVMALAGVLAASPLAAADVQPGETLLQVTATGTAKAIPDRVELSTGVTTDGSSAQAALNANATAAARLIGALRAVGVSAIDIQTKDLSVRPRFRRDKDDDETTEIVGYRASNRISVQTSSVANASKLIDVLFAAGATDLQGPNFSIADDTALRRAARTDAVSAARRQADDYAKALGLHIARVIRVSERAAQSYENSDIVVTRSRRASSPIEPGQQNVTVTTWIDYALTP